MTPLPLSLPHAIVFWLVNVLAFFPECQLIRRTSYGAMCADSSDSGSMRLIQTSQLLAFAAAFPLAFFEPAQFALRFRSICFWSGIVLILGGSLLRRHCRHLLGEYFTPYVRVVPGQPIVDHGAYRWIRHPSYLAALLLFSGIGLTLGNWASLLLLLATSAVVYHYRMGIEERVLETTLGEPYRAYKQKRKRLIPFIY